MEVAGRLAFDTTFLIDLQKERRAGAGGPAQQFLAEHQSLVMAISSVALGEFAEGFSDRSDPVFQQVLTSVQILEIDVETGWLYGQNARRLRRTGRLIGANDLWIGCSALRHGLSLVSRNGDHFRRVQGLEVMEY